MHVCKGVFKGGSTPPPKKKSLRFFQGIKIIPSDLSSLSGCSRFSRGWEVKFFFWRNLIFFGGGGEYILKLAFSHDKILPFAPCKYPHFSKNILYTHWLRKYMGSRSGGGTSKRRRSPPSKNKNIFFCYMGGGGHFVTLVSVGRGVGLLSSR